MSLPRRSPPVSPVVSSPAAALPVASASVSVYARVVKDGADPEWTAIELAAPVNIDALITEITQTLTVDPLHSSLSLLLDEQGHNTVQIRSQDDLDYLGGWLARSNLPLRFQIQLMEPLESDHEPVVVLDKPKRTCTTMTKAGWRAIQHEEEDWADADELFPGTPVQQTGTLASSTASASPVPAPAPAPAATPASTEPANRSSYPSVPAIETVPPSPIASSIKSRSSGVPSVVDLPAPSIGKGKHKEIQPEPEFEEPVVVEPAQTQEIQDLIPSRRFGRPTVQPAFSFEGNNVPVTVSASSTIVGKRSTPAQRLLFSHAAALRAMAATEPRGPLAPLAGDLDIAVEMIAEKGDNDVTACVANFTGQVRRYFENNRPVKTLMAPLEEDKVCEDIFAMMFDDPTLAREAIIKLVRERNDAIAVAAALGDVPDSKQMVAPPRTSSSPTPTPPARTRSASPANTAGPSRSPSPSLATAVNSTTDLLPFERSASLGEIVAPLQPAPGTLATPATAPSTSEADPLDGLPEEEKKRVAEEQDRILQMIRLEQIRREMPKPPVAVVQPVQPAKPVVPAKPQPAPAPASEKEKSKFNLFKKSTPAPVPAPAPSTSTSSAPRPQPQPTTRPSAPARSPLSFEQAQKLLQEMGFTDPTANAEVLQRCGGDFGRVVEELVSGGSVPQQQQQQQIVA